MITKREFEEYCSKNNLKSDWNNNDLFIILCCYGYIETLKWLYTKEIINIHTNNESAFIFCCKYGKIEVAKWLMEISKKNGEIINIHANNEEAFRKSCRNENLEVAKWLCSLCDEYYIKIKDDKIVKYGITNVFDKYLDENKGIKKIIRKLQLQII